MSDFTRRMFVAQSAAFGTASVAQQSEPAKLPPRRRLLENAWSESKLKAALAPREKWSPFPPARDRAGWEAVPSDAREALTAAGTEALDGTWPILPATLFLEFRRNGNRSRYEAVNNARRSRLRNLIMAECAEGKGRFVDEIANGVWTTCEETWWGFPAHMGLQRRGLGLPDTTEPTIDLFAAETGALLAWTEYLLGPELDKVDPLVSERIRLEIGRRILEPYRERIDFWWMGLNPEVSRSMNNWNPWINSNCLTCALLLERDPGRRVQFVHKVLRSLDTFLDSYHDDGGCDEGPGYWGHAGGALFVNLDLLHSASAGTIDVYSVPLIQEIGRYIYRAHIFDNWYVNFADASARVNLSGDLVYRYGRAIRDPHMQALGAHAAKAQSSVGRESIGRQLPALFNLAELRKAPASQPLVRDAWMPGIQVMAARVKQGSPAGLYLAAQGGHNAESHNHNDVGNFIVYSDGSPALIDVGVETYTAKTFSSRRYDIWTMQSAFHNVPTVNGVMQSAGRQFRARDIHYSTDDAGAEFSLDIAAAYPHDAGIEAWRRVLRLNRRTNAIEVSDSWQLRKPQNEILLTLMTPHPVRSEPGVLFIDKVRLKVTFDAPLSAAVEEIRIEDGRLKPAWGAAVRRILLKAASVPARGENVLRIAQV
jgi:hypothetical protein